MRIIQHIAAIVALTAIAVSTATAKTTQTKTVESGGTGAYKAVVVAESTLPDFTIYRPKDLAAAVAKEGPLPLLVWGNGACSNTNLGNEKMLNEIASHGYVVVAVGPFRMGDNDGFVDSGTDGTKMTQAVDWIMKQGTLSTSEYYGMIDTRKIAASGHSCGGAEAMYTSTDSRVTTIIMMNSGMGGMGMAGASPANLKSIHGPILYVVGGPDDVAYGNALSDYDNITVKQPVCFMTKPVGHGGTFWDAHGGDYGQIMPDWLDWVFKAKRENIKIFRDGVMKRYSGWELKSKNMPVYMDESAPQAMQTLNYMHATFALPTSSDGGEKVEWQLDETLPGYVHLTARSLVIDRHPEGDTPLTVGRLVANITYGGATTQIANWITLAPTDTTAGVLLSYVDAASRQPRLAYARHASKKLSYAQLPDDAALFDAEAVLPQSQGAAQAYIYRDDCGGGFLMTCSDATPEGEGHAFALLRSTDLSHWRPATIDLWQGRPAFIDSTKSAAYITNERYQRIVKASAPRMVRLSAADRQDTLPYMLTTILRSTIPSEKNARLFYAYADSSFAAMTQPRLLFDPAADVVDAAIEFSPYDSLYHMLYITSSGEGTVLRHATSARLLKGTWSDNAVVLADVKNPIGVAVYRSPGKAQYNIYTFSTGGTITHWQADVHFAALTKLGTYTRPKGLPGEAVFISESEYNALANWGTPVQPVAAVVPSSNARYTLMGQPAARTYRGIVVENGRKLLIP